MDWNEIMISEVLPLKLKKCNKKKTQIVAKCDIFLACIMLQY